MKEAGENSEAILDLVMGMFAAFPTVQVTDETFQIYVRMLADIPLAILTVARDQALAGKKFPPTIGEIRDIALSLITPFRREGSEAWGLVVKAMQDVGYYHSPAFDDPLITKMVEIMGWRTLCLSENQVADRAHFIKHYEILAARELADAKLLPCARELRQLASAPVKEIANGQAAA